MSRAAQKEAGKGRAAQEAVSKELGRAGGSWQGLGCAGGSQQRAGPRRRQLAGLGCTGLVASKGLTHSQGVAGVESIEDLMLWLLR